MRHTSNIISALIPAAFFTLTITNAVALDLIYHPPHTGSTTVGIQATLPSLRCGVAGRPSNECLLGGTLQIRGAAGMNGPLRYSCAIHYNHVAKEGDDFRVSFSSEDRSSPAQAPVTPGVGPQEKNKPLLNSLDFGKPAQKPEPVRLKGTAYYHGTVLLKDGRGENNLADSPPLMLPKQAERVVLERFECRQE